MRIRDIGEISEQEMLQLTKRGVFRKEQIIEAVEIIEKFIEEKNRSTEQKVVTKNPVLCSITVPSYEPLMIESYNGLLKLAEFQLKQLKDIGFSENGKTTRVEFYPYRRVGAYVPSSLPSTLLTIAANAKAAGVEQVVICTKPNSNGKISKEFMTAAGIAGIRDIYTVSSARLAIPALGFGTSELEKVEKIVGPCSPFVDVVKQLMPLYGVAVDMRANSSELIVIADYNEKQVALDMVAQAEHHIKGESQNQKKFIAITQNKDFARSLYDQIMEIASNAPEHVRQSIDALAEIILAKYTEAVGFCNAYYPEVLELWVRNQDIVQELLKNLACGKIYINTPAAVGDYAFVGSGCNDPTGGIKMPGINVLTYMNRREINWMSEEQLQKDKPKVEKFAELEGLVAHAESVRAR